MSTTEHDIVLMASQYIPKEQRISLLKSLLEIYGSIYKTSKITKISRPQLYRYLATEKKSYPNDEVTSRIVLALLEVKRSWVKEQLKHLSKDFNELITKM
jgi:hypothetical protein